MLFYSFSKQKIGGIDLREELKNYEHDIEDVYTITPKAYSDQRGFFYESYNKKQFKILTGFDLDFVQDNGFPY